MYPEDYHDKEKAGKPYHPPSNSMVVMNNQGIFFEFCGEPYYPSIRPLKDVLYSYDVVWKD